MPLANSTEVQIIGSMHNSAFEMFKVFLSLAPFCQSGSNSTDKFKLPHGLLSPIQSPACR